MHTAPTLACVYKCMCRYSQAKATVKKTIFNDEKKLDIRQNLKICLLSKPLSKYLREKYH